MLTKDEAEKLLREAGAEEAVAGLFYVTAKDIAAVIAAHTAKVLGDVEPVGEVILNYSTHMERCHPDGPMNDVAWLVDAAVPKSGTKLYPAHTVAALAARVAELEKDALRYRWLRSVPNAFKAQRIVNDTPHGMDATIDAAMNGGNQ